MPRLNRPALTNQLLEHQVTALFIIGHHTPEPAGVLGIIRTDQLRLLTGQAIVDHEQLHAAALRQAQNLRGNVLFVDEDQIVRAVLALQGRARLFDRALGGALRILHLKLHA